MPLLASFTALSLLLCCTSSAYLLTLAWGARRSGSARVCATLGLAYGLLIAGFELLASVRGFTLGLALPLWGALTALLAARGHGRARAALRWDVGRARVLARRVLTGWRRWLVLGAALLAGARLLRGLAAPPLAWDALTYHLVKAGRWVQSGGYEPLRAPDAWGYYAFFLPYGDALWAWAMLPAHGDGFLAPAGLLVWGGVLAGAYGTARALRVRRRLALPVALTVAFLPAVVTALTAAYVDNTVLALFLLAMATLLSAPPWSVGTVATAAALGVLAGVKPGGLSVYGLGAAVLGAGLARTWRAGEGRRVLGAWSALALLLGALPYLRTWVLTGSPLYPYPLTVAGVRVSAGNAQLAELSTGALNGHPPVRAAEVVQALLLSRFLSGLEHVGFGPALLLAPAGLMAAARAWRRRDGRALTLLVMGLATLAGVMNPALWAIWTDSSVRFVAPLMATLLLLAATLEEPGLGFVLWSCLALELVCAIPHGWSQVDVSGVRRVAPPVLLALAGSAVAPRWGARRRRPWLGAAVAVVLLGVAWVPIAATRRALRYDFYAAASDGKTFELHPLLPAYASSWPIWKELDGEAPKRLAVSAGWDGTGHNWFWYPLMGSQLQNTLTYVPVLPEGTVADYAREETLARADFLSWWRRLEEQRVELVVTLAPAPPEARWMSEHPEHFQCLVTSTQGRSAAWRVVGQ